MITGKKTVVDRLGYWPEFCDARVNKINFDLKGELISLSLSYIDVDIAVRMEISFVFLGVRQLAIKELLDSAVLDSLELISSERSGTITVFLTGAYGVLGKFSCTDIEIGDVSYHSV